MVRIYLTKVCCKPTVFYGGFSSQELLDDYLFANLAVLVTMVVNSDITIPLTWLPTYTSRLRILRTNAPFRKPIDYKQLQLLVDYISNIGYVCY